MDEIDRNIQIDSDKNMKIKAVSFGTKVKTFTFKKGAVLSDLLKKWRYPRKNESVFINTDKMFDFNASLKNGDIIVIASPIRAAAPPPLMKEFKKYLVHIGFRFYQKGKGDHEIWINEREIKLTVNPNKKDKRYVDRASVSALKRILNCSEGSLIKRINNL